MYKPAPPHVITIIALCLLLLHLASAGVGPEEDQSRAGGGREGEEAQQQGGGRKEEGAQGGE